MKKGMYFGLLLMLGFSLMSATCSSDDDDFDFDDDCGNCSIERLETVLSACSDWYIDDLERNNNNLDNNYIGYRFNFSIDNGVTVTWGNNTETGTWSVEESGNSIYVTFDIPGFDDINDTWRLDDIDNDDDDDDDDAFEVDFEIGDDDLEFENENCDF
ncbi:hypothetical protein ITJ86_04475 [Winogradskyella sp. F6397]|uniref:Lipoprotein n=1 Tax=Winogradskyella marina TaxID=2785530 RepID=A0ABS0EFA0_9FLAO|nr:hypothetical protein [Winogradskyella marina]MBF8149138.1 hypothetical protein [Winogradskyella marina]